MKVGYCRVSSAEQATRTNALEQQKSRILSEGVDKLIIDVESGYKDRDREGLTEMMDLVKNGIVTEVIITRLDRLGRSVVHLNKLVQEMKKYNCVLRALDDNINLNTVDGRLHFNLLASFAQSESDRLSERVKHGMEHRRSQQKLIAKIPFGYTQCEGKYILDINPFICTISDHQSYSKCEIAKKILLIYLSQKSIAKTLSLILDYYGFGVLSYDGLKHWLSNPILEGHTVYKSTGQIYYNTHPAIISPSVRQEIQLTKNQSSYTRRHTTGVIYPYSGKIYCASCGSNCIITTNRKINHVRYYKCKQLRSKTVICRNSRYTRLDVIESTFIRELIKRSDDILKLVSRERTEVESPELLQLRSQREALLAIPTNPAIDKAIREIDNQIYKLSSITNHLTHNNNLLAVLSSPLFWETLNPSDKKNIVWLLVDKILILDSKVQLIQFKSEYDTNNNAGV